MILSLLMSIIFGGSAYIIWKITKDNTSPYFILFFVWTFYMLMLTIFHKSFYSLDIITCAVYWIGANCFLMGAILYGTFEKRIKLKIKNKKQLLELEAHKRLRLYEIKGKRIKIMLWITLVILGIGIVPYYYNQIQLSGASISNLKNFFWLIRHAELAGGTSKGFSIINNFPVVARIATLYFYFLYKIIKKNKIPTFLLITLTLAYCLLTGGRAEIVRTMLALVGIEAIYNKKWFNKNLILIAFLMLSLSSAFAYFYGKSSINNDLSFFKNIYAIVDDIIIYMLGGIVAFKNVINGVVELTYNGGVFRFFIQTANSLGANFEVSSLFMPFSYINDGLITNVYTMYGDFSIHSGLPGSFVLTSILGFAVAFIYSKTKMGKTVWIVLYAQMISNIIMSGYSDGFYILLNFHMKLFILTLLYDNILRFSLKKKVAVNSLLHRG